MDKQVLDQTHAPSEDPEADRPLAVPGDDPAMVAEPELRADPLAELEAEEEGALPASAMDEVDPDELYVDFDTEPESLTAGLELEFPAPPPEEPSIEEPETEPAPPASGETASAEPGDGRQWYVLHCYSGYENKVRHAIEQRIETMGMRDKIFDVVIPTEEEIEVKDGKRRTVESRVFPGYILVQMILNDDSWYVVRNTPGVTGFAGMGNTPTPLRPEEVNQII